MPTCKGKTKKGLPCKGGAMAGSDFCGPHTDWRPKADQLPLNTSVLMDWDDPVCVAAYMKEMDELDGV